MTYSQEHLVDGDIHPVKNTYNYKRNAAKAIFTLKGTLENIQADKSLEESDILFLNAWMSNAEGMKNHDLFADIYGQILIVLQAGRLSQYEKAMLEVKLLQLTEDTGFADSQFETNVNHILGFLSGISADDKLCDEELAQLATLLNQNPAMTAVWPVSALLYRLRNIADNSEWDINEQDDFLKLIKSISGQSLDDNRLLHGVSADFSTSQETDISVEGKSICFAGQFLSGSSAAQQEKALRLGAEIQSRVTKCLDILVLGSVANKDWRSSNYGRKIESALKVRAKGGNVQIINEEQWNIICS
ncbi:BRCT domain-containing protein [Vibrio taketomensis]|uniref:BRCT domain-containing protein n=1 Tax=Vibrio taketomensis TaxID=2572923 RepID=UPI0013898422|nr:BRCT domain-containing protein [Vibrio taketomensis]